MYEGSLKLHICHDVAGAKEAHAVSPHFAQIMYFGLVSAAAMAPMHFSFGQISVLCQLFWKNKLLNLSLGLIALTVGLIAVHFFRSIAVSILIFLNFLLQFKFNSKNLILVKDMFGCTLNHKQFGILAKQIVAIPCI